MPSARTEQAVARLADLSPRMIVAELDRYIIGQADAKKAVAIALRNRWRRQRAPESIRQEIAPNNIILIGPTGVGKTEIARRLAKLASAPFVKVEASKFTEVGYVGRDVESMVRDLVEAAIDMVRAEREGEVEDLANERVDERLLDLLLPPPPEVLARRRSAASVVTGAARADGAESAAAGAEAARAEAARFTVSATGDVKANPEVAAGAAAASSPAGPAEAAPVGSAGEQATVERYERTRDKLRALLIDGNLDGRDVEIEVVQKGPAMPDTAAGGAPDGMEQFGEWLRDLLPKRKKRRTVKVREARRILFDEEVEKLIDLDDVTADALERTEQLGIIFLDEIDKIAGERGTTAGPDVSREGVQRDLLPIVEGSNVSTRYGMVKTDHILFVAAGAFHVSKPSDLIPELQGRFPIRVELKSLTEDDFVRILTAPEHALTKQYAALIEAEQASVSFTEGGIREIARIATRVNEQLENIGARRLHTVMTTLLEDVLFELPDRGTDPVAVDDAMVRDRLKAVVEDEDLRKYIL